MNVEKVISAVNSLDLKTLPLENVEIVQRTCPTEQEVSFFFLFPFFSDCLPDRPF